MRLLPVAEQLGLDLWYRALVGLSFYGGEAQRIIRNGESQSHGALSG